MHSVNFSAINPNPQTYGKGGLRGVGREGDYFVWHPKLSVAVRYFFDTFCESVIFRVLDVREIWCKFEVT